MPEPVFVKSSSLEFPANRDAPIAANLAFSMSHGQGDLQAVFDWRQTGPQTWDIEVETEAGLTLKLTHGGSCLEIGGRWWWRRSPPNTRPSTGASTRCSMRASRRSTTAPFRLVADAFMIGKRVQVEAFED